MKFLNAYIFCKAMIKLPYTISNMRYDCLKTLSYAINRRYHTKINPIGKRGTMLSKLLRDKDKKKHWLTQIAPNPETKKKNVFEKIYRPNKRERILNSVLVKNITDVLSTGDVAPDIVGKGIEITGVKIAPCFRILNIFWQVPPQYFGDFQEIDMILNMKAPEIRSELISRNVIGRVPKIYFIRDHTNAKVAAFEEAMREIDLGSEKDSAIVPDDSFVEDIYSFKKKTLNKFEIQAQSQTEITNETVSVPSKPLDMKSDVFGLDHDALMSKVISRKKKDPTQQSTSVVSLESLANGDLFSKIPGEVFQGEFTDRNREKILKEFHIQRKLMKKKDDKKDADLEVIFNTDLNHEYVLQEENTDEDFIEEE